MVQDLNKTQKFQEKETEANQRKELVEKLQPYLGKGALQL